MSELRCLHNLTASTLRELASEIEALSAISTISFHRVQQVVGTSAANAVHQFVQSALQDGWNSAQVALLLRGLAESREYSANPEELLDVVLSGPEVLGVPTRDTSAVMQSMVARAQSEVLLVGYAVYNGKKLFEPLSTRLIAQPQLKVRLLLNIPRQPHDTSLDFEIVRRFKTHFYLKHWPWDAKPEIYYDPRSLSLDPATRASLHAKCIVVDRQKAFVTSANFTEAAHTKNVEAGVIVSYEPFARRISDYFDGLIRSSLRPIE